MAPLIDRHRDRLIELCRRHGVERMYVFGSAAREDFDAERSDIDLLVEFEHVDPVSLKRHYFTLLDALERLFGRDVDLLTPAMLRNPRLRAAVERTRDLLYAA